MPTGMGATNPKFAKSVRKPKKTDNFKFLGVFLNGCREKVPTMRSTNVKLEQTILNRRNQEDSPRMKFGGIK